MKSATILLALVALIGACVGAAGQSRSMPHKFAVTKTDAEWKKQLGPEAYDVLRHAGTEKAFSSPLDLSFKKGTYVCAGCGQELFSSDTKFDSGTGWPSFFRPINKDAVLEVTDHSYGMERTEIICSRCGGHLGHVFNDGPQPTGLRYCMNGVALKFVKPKSEKSANDAKKVPPPHR